MQQYEMPCALICHLLEIQVLEAVSIMHMLSLFFFLKLLYSTACRIVLVRYELEFYRVLCSAFNCYNA
jgi:hypothetical protein